MKVTVRRKGRETNCTTAVLSARGAGSPRHLTRQSGRMWPTRRTTESRDRSHGPAKRSRVVGQFWDPKELTPVALGRIGKHRQPVLVSSYHRGRVASHTYSNRVAVGERIQTR